MSHLAIKTVRPSVQSVERAVRKQASKNSLLFLRACFPTARSPSAPYFGWCLGGVTFNLKISGQFLRAVPKMCAVSQKNITDRTQKLNFACGW
jgi:hypothetical protein